MSRKQLIKSLTIENVTIKNNDKIGFKNVSLYCSEVKKVFQLIGVNACYTSFDNVYVGDTETDTETEGDFVCDSVKEIASSYLEHVKLQSLDRVDSCYLSAYIYENDGKISNLINVNSNEEKILPKDTKLEIL